MAPYLKGAKRIAYDGLGFITHAFIIIFRKYAPGRVDFCQEFAWLRACKGEEEFEVARNTCRSRDAMFRSALYIQPGRTVSEMFADVTRYLLLLGGDLDTDAKDYVCCR